MTQAPYIHDVKDAAYAAREWPTFIDPDDMADIKKAMFHVVEHMKQEGSDTDDRVPGLPAFAVPRLLRAMKNIHNVERRCERDLERHKAPKGRFG